MLTGFCTRLRAAISLAIPALAWSAGLAAALPAVDPPVRTVSIDHFQDFLGVDGDGFYYSASTTQFVVSLQTLPLGGEPPTGRPVSFPAGFKPLGVAKGKIYGFMDLNGGLSQDVFRAFDAETQQEVASYPLVRSQSYGILRFEDGCIFHRQFSTGATVTLVHFDAASREIKEKTFNSGTLGRFSSARLVGRGEDWLAFQVSELQGRHELITVDATTLAKKVGVTIPGSPVSSPIEASGADTHFQILENGEVLAVDVHSGVSTSIGKAEEGAVRYAQFIAARGDVLWVQGRLQQPGFGPSELQMWRKDAGGRWKMKFRGDPGRAAMFDTPFRDLIATENGCFSKGENVVDYYVPALSRPILMMPTEVRLKDGGGKQEVKVQLDRPATEPLSVRVRSGGGTATPELDYVSIDQVLHFPTGSREVEFEVDVKSDLLPEAHETIGLLFSEAAGMNLPKVSRGSLVIQASGLELQAMRFLSSNGNPVDPAKLWMRDEEVTIGVADIPTPGSTPRVCVWDNETGALRGTIPDVPTEVNYPPYPRFLPTPEGVDVHYEKDGKFVLARVSRENGSVIESGTFRKPPTTVYGVVLLGGGRAIFSYSANGGSGSWAARMIEIGGIPEGTLFPDPVPDWRETYPAFISDGRFLVGSWGSHSSAFGIGKPSRLGAFDPVTLAPLWEMAMPDFQYVAPIAIRGNLLVFGTNDSVNAMDLTTREILWRQRAEIGASAVGDTLWFGNGGNRGVYDLATGAAVGDPRYLIEETDATYQNAVAGIGGVLVRGGEAFPEPPGTGGAAVGGIFHLVSDRRTRPAVQLLNQSAEQSHDGSQLSFRVVEVTDVPVEISVRYSDPRSVIQPPPPVYPQPVALPLDGSAAGIPYRLQPTGGPAEPSVLPFSVKISSPGRPSLAGTVRLPFVSGVPVAPAHLGAVIARTPTSPLPAGQSHPDSTGLRVCDDKIVAFTGSIRTGTPADRHRVDVFDVATGNLLRSIVDPVPLPNRLFGINAIAQGDRVLVVSRLAGGETGTAEIFSISTGLPLAALAHTGKIPGFGDFLAANATYFAIATPGLDRGQPAGSQVEVFRWSDFKRVFRKSGGKNSQFGSGMVFKGDTLYVSAPGGSKAGKPQDPVGGKVFGFPIGGKGKVAVPEGASGALVADDSNLIAGNLLQLRAYDSATMRLKWNVPFVPNLMEYRGPISAGEGVVSVRDLRDLVMLDAANGEPVGATRFFTAIDNAYYGNLIGAEFANGSLFTLIEGTITRWPMHALGNFSTWRWLQGLSVTEVSHDEDRDGNGSPDFDDYVASRLNPAAPFATAVHEEGKVKLDSVVTPPPDVLVVAEAEVKPGTWSPIGWRDGHAQWAGPGLPSSGGPLLVPLPARLVTLPPLRFRYLPGGSLGSAWGKTVWPPEDRIEQTAAASKALAVVPDEDGDGLPDWLQRQLGLQHGEMPLGLISGTEGAGVSYLRPLGGQVGFEVESSEDLITWRSASDDPGVNIHVVPESESHERVFIRGKAGTPQRFFRVKY